ncbi:hypothetical protein K469DRAFT_689829 [Zopfia rhizophila CBS 207.26]|uniref:Mid2 domain-containing protein n=1 Tax=Zopfia rhizophila CBS 207.26 TaxID=1314779 RepID=A0A6A6DY39_9PEZI|nr:hypothetical protein K469DRAFT_689829 [Zopfia rhizophila CBS 207.26]
MRFLLLCAIIAFFAWSVVATHPEIIQRQNSRSSSRTATRISTGRPTPSPTSTVTSSREFTRTQTPGETTTQGSTSSITSHTRAPTNRPERPPKSGLNRGAKIGIGVGVPLGVIAIAGALAAYIVGKRRGRKRRVDDPFAGAGKRVQDPSYELNIPPPTPATPAVAELPTVRSDEFPGAQSPRAQWWKSSFGRSEPTKKYAYQAAPGNEASQSPQELPA